MNAKQIYQIETAVGWLNGEHGDPYKNELILSSASIAARILRQVLVQDPHNSNRGDNSNA